MSIKIIKPAMITTLVAGPRKGYRRWGIGAGGAMDMVAMKVSNFLVGNEGDQAALELGYSSSQILILHDSLISASGKGFELYLNDKLFPLWHPVKVKANTLLRLTKTPGGTWAYLAVQGGWKAEDWLGSCTTNSAARKGGYLGRMLQTNDMVEAETNYLADETGSLPWSISVPLLNQFYSPFNEIRCMPSIETDWLSESSKQVFSSGEFGVSSQSNRMGYRLNGPLLFVKEKNELVSSPVEVGIIQLLPDGNLVMLMADSQTTGGYPRIASVAQADLPKLAQHLPGEKIYFKWISFLEAENLLQDRDTRLAELKHSCHLQLSLMC